MIFEDEMNLMANGPPYLGSVHVTGHCDEAKLPRPLLFIVEKTSLKSGWVDPNSVSQY